MKRVLLTGMSGTGKSTVIEELLARGFHAIESDEDGLSVPVNGEMLWQEDRIHRILADHTDGLLVISGCTRNMVTFYPQFDHIILLSAPAEVIVQRLATRTTNDYGKRPEQLAEVLENLEAVEPLLRRSATLEIDTSETTPDEVVDRILAHVDAGHQPTRRRT